MAKFVSTQTLPAGTAAPLIEFVPAASAKLLVSCPTALSYEKILSPPLACTVTTLPVTPSRTTSGRPVASTSSGVRMLEAVWPWINISRPLQRVVAAQVGYRVGGERGRPERAVIQNTRPNVAGCCADGSPKRRRCL